MSLENVRKGVHSLRAGVARAAGKLPGSSLVFGPPRRQAVSTEINDRSRLIRHALVPARIAHRPAAEMADPPLDQWMREPGRADIKEIFVAELPQGRYWNRYHGYIIDRNDTLITDLSPTFTPPGRRHDGLEHIKLPRVEHVRGTVAVMTTLFGWNFHHWLLDAVPRFEWLRRAGWTWDKIDRFILPRKMRRFHHEILGLLGIDPAKVICAANTPHLCADLLLAPSHSEPAALPLEYGYTPEGLKFVHDLVLKDNPFLQRRYPRRIIVSREKARARRLVQAARIHPMLFELGFEKVLLEDHSLQEQAAMFHQADCVIMPTGGNLANFIYCRPGTVAIELFSPRYYPPFTYSLLGEMDLRYYGLVADKISQPFPGADEGRQDIDFDPDRLVGIVREALAKFNSTWVP